MSLQDRLSRMVDRPALTSPSAESEVGCREFGVEDLLEYEVSAQPHHSIHHRRNTEFPLLAGSFLRDQLPAGGFETIMASSELVSDQVEQFLFPIGELLHRHAVYPGCSGVLLDLFPRRAQSSPVKDPFHHPLDFHSFTPPGRFLPQGIAGGRWGRSAQESDGY